MSEEGIPCELCGHLVDFAEYEAHMAACEGAEDEAETTIPCQFCSADILVSEYEEHERECEIAHMPKTAKVEGGKAKGGGGKYGASSFSSTLAAATAGPRPLSANLLEDLRISKEESLAAIRSRPHHALEAFLLSPETQTETEEGNQAAAAAATPPVMKKEEIQKLLNESVAGIGSMRDRTNSHPVSVFIIGTYQSGLPLYRENGMQAVQEHTIFSMRYIFHKMKTADMNERRRVFTRMAEAFQSCQAVQSRVIDSVYGMVSGRDKSLREQVLILLDEEKQRVVDEVTLRIDPAAATTDDGNPQGQVPHLQNAYRRTVGLNLGLRGIPAARVDRCAPMLDRKKICLVERLFRETFRIEDFADILVGDVNQPNAAPGGRRIDRVSLAKWAGEQMEHGFPSHSIYYQEEFKKEKYNDTEPPAEEMFEPFLSREAAIILLTHLFLSAPKPAAAAAVGGQ